MTSLLLSDKQREFIVSGVKVDFRNDGRSCKDYRKFDLTTDHVISNANASSRVKLGGTDVVVGVKAELTRPDPARPNEGALHFLVDCSAVASPEFERRGGEELGAWLGQLVQRAYQHPGCLRLDELCVSPGQRCWTLYIDGLVTEWGGNVLDCLSIAIRSALHQLRLPRVSTSGEGEELEVELDPDTMTPLEGAKLPVYVTLSQIGDSRTLVVDTSLEEAACVSSRLMVGINEDGHLCGFMKEGRGGMSRTMLNEALLCAQEVGVGLIKTTNGLMDTSKMEVDKIT